MDYVVIRNGSYRRSEIRGINDHNERRKDSYRNPDIDPQRSSLNVHFKNPNASYTEVLDRLVADEKVSLRGLKGDAILFDEFLLDVNSHYFERKGGYETAKVFFENAYRFACTEVGEDNILSAVMHADERNQALTEVLGHDVWHYHMHVVYLPTVQKEVRYSKRCKDPALVGTVKEIVTQVSHSKRWKSMPVLSEDGKSLRDEKGRVVLEPSYGELQTRFAQYMQAHGYTDVERGMVDRKAKHKSIVEFKLAQDEARAKAAAAKVDQLKNVSAQLTADITAQQETLTDLRDMEAYVEEVARCRSVLQQLFDAIEAFFLRTTLLRDKKGEAAFFQQVKDGLMNFFSRLRNLLGFELITKMPLDQCQSPQLAIEGEKMALSLQIATAERRTDTTTKGHKGKEYTR